MLTDNAAARTGRWVTEHPWTVIVITLLLAFAAAAGGKNLFFTTDYRAFFSSENPQLIAFEDLQDEYTKNDSVIFILTPENGELYDPEFLEAVQWLTEESWQIPYSIRVDSVTNFQHTRAEEDDLIVEDLVGEPTSLESEQLGQVRDVARNEPQLFQRLVSDRDHVTGINVTIQLPGVAPAEEVPEVANFSRDLKQRLEEKYPSVEARLSGIVMMNMTFQEASQQDLMTLVPAMYLVILVALGLMLRSFSGTVATLFLLTFSIMGAMGLAGWVRLGLTGPSVTAPTIILTLAVADSVHILATMFHEMRHNGLAKKDAIVESLRVNYQPIFLTSLTTAIGFLTMNFGEVPPFAHLGNITAVGVLIAFLLSITFLPAAMTVLPVKVKPVSTQRSSLMDRLADFVIARKQFLFWAMAIVMVALIAFIPRNELNDNFLEYFDDSFDFRQSSDYMTENLTGLYDVHYSLGSGESEGVSDPEFLEKVQAFTDWFRSQPQVVHVNVITDTFKRLNKNLHGDDDAYYRIPEQKDLAAQYLLLYEMSLPYGLDLNNQLSVDKSATKLSVVMETMTTNEVLVLMDEARAWLDENGLPDMKVEGSSTTVMFANIGYRNIRAMLIAAIAALVIISLLLIFALKSLKYGLISLVPNLAPAAVGFGIWGLLYSEVGLALSVVVSVTLGVVVDDTIHFMSKYLRARREQGLAGEEAIRYAFRRVGMALLVTTIVLTAGFLVLALSPFKVNSDMGLMTAITISLALIIDFLFLPPLLLKLEEKEDAKINSANTGSGVNQPAST